ncbi:helix-turn-helix domain-containing protein [Haloplanus salilacus]|uniref:helix-turn-helix domain-containing protein n=1 Tax=Haloplanus salilacus TaxID=2949994 RepID=UPI0030CC109B
MPKQLSNEQRREILLLRAMDYTKQDIADEVDVSRNTVSRHLTEMREEIENSEHREMALAEILFEPDDLLPFVLEQAGISLSDLNEDVLQRLVSK